MDRESLEDLFRPFGPVQIKRMFGGWGIFADALMFGLYARGNLYLKADGESAVLFATAGSSEFRYQRGEKTIGLGYWSLPDRGLDDPEELVHWCCLALAAARRKTIAKSQGKPVRAHDLPSG
jgi:DNA transformation protein